VKFAKYSQLNKKELAILAKADTETVRYRMKKEDIAC
jgi:hypothetical protein